MEPNMNKLVIIAGFALYLVVFVRTSPNNETMLSLLASTENHTDYKCPYLRSTMLNEAQFDFFKICLGSMKIRTNSDMLCVLFYNNFLKLCNYSMRNNFDLKTLLNDSTIKASLAQKNVEGVCDNLKTTEPINPSLGPTLTRINGFMAQNCPFICVSIFDNSTFPICAMTAMMNGFAKQYSNIEAGPVRKQEVKTDKGVKTQPEVATPPKTNETKPVESGKSGAKKDVVVKLLQAPPPRQEEKVAESPPKKEPEQPKPKPDVEKSAPAKPEKTVQDTPKEVPKVEPPKQEVKEKKVEDAPKVAEVPEVPNESSNDNKQEGKAKVEDSEKVEVVNENHDSQYELDDDIAILKTEEDEPSLKAGKPKPKETNEDAVPANPNNQMDEEDSFFFVYFMMVCAVFILGYIGYHNKQKVLALVIEGRRGRRGSRRGGRPNSANYHKLDSNLEEAVTSSVHKNATNIIY